MKWNHQTRLCLYAHLVMRAGAYDPQGTLLPDDRDKRQAALAEITRYLQFTADSTVTPEAVELQVKFAETRQPEVPRSQLGTWLANKAAALEAGYIKAADFPAQITITA